MRGRFVGILRATRFLWPDGLEVRRVCELFFASMTSIIFTSKTAERITVAGWNCIKGWMIQLFGKSKEQKEWISEHWEMLWLLALLDWEDGVSEW